ncbi:MAG: short chain dehydrogenase [Bacteroidales bacterium]|nr:short chain dehydrogenase [Bacteroidales bacterium]
MKILIIGGNGTIGKKVTEHFSQNHEVIVAGRTSGELNVDISDSGSITNLLQKTGSLDAIICIAGIAKWAPFNEMTEEDFEIGLKSKLMGQVNLVRIGQDYINAGGSITLTTGILADDPVVMTTSAAIVNGAIHSFVKAVVLEIESGVRVNVVAPGLVEDSAEKYKDYFPGHSPIPMKRVVRAYIRSVEGRVTGEVIRIYS